MGDPAVEPLSAVGLRLTCRHHRAAKQVGGTGMATAQELVLPRTGRAQLEGGGRMGTGYSRY